MQKQIGTFLQLFVGNISDGIEEINGYMREVVDIQKLLRSFVAVT
jgi:hypothetical protein